MRGDLAIGRGRRADWAGWRTPLRPAIRTQPSRSPNRAGHPERPAYVRHWSWFLPLSPWSSRSPDLHAAIDHQVDAGHVRAFVGDEVERTVCNVLGLSESSQQGPR